MEISSLHNSDCVILCNGQFPSHDVPLALLRNARIIVCCDGSVEKLRAFGMEPSMIVGDLDSAHSEVLQKYADRVFHNPDQETNDLTKSVQWVVSQGIRKVTILGATGLREDHTLGNISLLAEYIPLFDSVQMVTDFGSFHAISKSTTFRSLKGQQISIFTIHPETTLASEGLQYPLPPHLASWWCGTLNEALGDTFTIQTDGRTIVYQAFEVKKRN